MIQGCVIKDIIGFCLQRFNNLSKKQSLFYFLLFPLLLQSRSVIVQWDQNSESDLSGYKIYYGTASRRYDKVLDVGNVTSYRITELEPQVRYFFAITAYDFAGNESNYSEEVDVLLQNDSTDSSHTNTGTLLPLVYNFPNPFKINKEITTIRYELLKSSEVSIEIYDLNNTLIKILLQNAVKSAGEHIEDFWDGTNAKGDFVSNGVYLCRVRANGMQKIIKIAVLR